MASNDALPDHEDQDEVNKVLLFELHFLLLHFQIGNDNQRRRLLIQQLLNNDVQETTTTTTQVKAPPKCIKLSALMVLK